LRDKYAYDRDHPEKDDKCNDPRDFEFSKKFNGRRKKIGEKNRKNKRDKNIVERSEYKNDRYKTYYDCGKRQQPVSGIFMRHNDNL
jgi:hypothetical protein